MSEPQFHHTRCGLEQGVLVITITERQVQGDELADALRKEFFQALEGHPGPRVVIDFRHVTFLSSAGFRPLLSLYRKLHGQGGGVILCNLAPNVEEVFRITRLVSTSRQFAAPFETAANVDEAVTRQAGNGSASPSA